MDPEESDKQRKKADQMLQEALIMFPGGLTVNIYIFNYYQNMNI